MSLNMSAGYLKTAARGYADDKDLLMSDSQSALIQKLFILGLTCILGDLGTSGWL